MLEGIGPLMRRQKCRHVLIDQPLFHLLDRQDVTIAHDEIDIVEGDALRIEAIIDHIPIKAGGVLLAGDPLLGDRNRNRAVLEQTGADVMIVGVEAEDVDVLLLH